MGQREINLYTEVQIKYNLIPRSSTVEFQHILGRSGYKIIFSMYLINHTNTKTKI